MNTMTQAYRTTCIPNRDDKIDTIIPSDYIGREIEIVMYPVYEEHEYNEETLAAMQEVRDIRAGKIKTRSYATVAEMNAALDAEED
jgi:hypothetical protein